MADIFISYKKEDSELAQKVVSALEAEGFTTWWDDRIAPSSQWDEVIEREITAARAVVVLWTPKSVRSQWVRSEAQFGVNAEKLVPLTLAPCTPPLAFLLIQSIDLTRWNGDRTQAAWLKVTAYLSDVMKGAARAAAAVADANPAPRADWRAAFGAHVNGEPILLGDTITPAAPTGTVFKDGPDLPLMCVIGAGGFVMGAARGSAESQENEYPQRRVEIGKFALGVYEITSGEWEAARKDGGVAHKPADHGWGVDERLPVVNVSWNDAQSFIRWLSKKSGERYRLPSEAEWEYACRAGAAGAYAFDGAMTPDHACYGAKRPTPVGSYPPNAFGLYDMHGNVREWVEDLWHDSYVDAPIDAIAWTSGHSAMRVVRGGAWLDEPWFLRSASRGRASAPDRCNFIGFRVARDIG